MIQKYLGPRVGYTSDCVPLYHPEKWLMEYLDILKKRYYAKRIAQRKMNKLKVKKSQKSTTK
jgi:hypothetical protein